MKKNIDRRRSEAGRTGCLIFHGRTSGQLFEYPGKIVNIMKTAFNSNLAAGIKSCGEVFFCVFNANVVQGGKNGIAGGFFEYAV